MTDKPPREQTSAASARQHPIDIIDSVLRPLLGSLPGTEAAVSVWAALRRAGYLTDAPESEEND